MNAREYEIKIQELIEKKDLTQLARVAKSAFKDLKDNERTLSWIAGIVFESGALEGFDLIADFVQRFPTSLHPIRAYYADLWASQDKYDQASHEARIYLRLLTDEGKLERLKDDIDSAGAARAFLLLTAVHTEVGARNYSQRVLKKALNLELPKKWNMFITREIQTLKKELLKAEAKAMDKKWEAFYQQASHAKELIQYCKQKKFPLLVKRLEILTQQIKAGSSLHKSDNEYLLVTYSSPDGTTVLG